MLKIINGTMDQKWPHKVKKKGRGGERKERGVTIWLGWGRPTFYIYIEIYTTKLSLEKIYVKLFRENVLV